MQNLLASGSKNPQISLNFSIFILQQKLCFQNITLLMFQTEMYIKN